MRSPTETSLPANNMQWKSALCISFSAASVLKIFNDSKILNSTAVEAVNKMLKFSSLTSVLYKKACSLTAKCSGWH